MVDTNDNNGTIRLAARDSYQNIMFIWTAVPRRAANGVRGPTIANVPAVVAEESRFKPGDV